MVSVGEEECSFWNELCEQEEAIQDPRLQVYNSQDNFFQIIGEEQQFVPHIFQIQKMLWIDSEVMKMK